MNILSWVSSLKNSRFIYDLVRRNPLAYGSIKRRLSALELADGVARGEFTERRLARVLAWAGKTRYGRKHACAAFAQWPVLEKQDLLGKEGDFLGRPSWLCVTAKTSGTTGTPLTTYRSLHSLLLEQIFLDYVDERQGMDPRTMRTAILRGDAVIPPETAAPPYWRKLHGGRTLILSSSHLNAKTLDCFVDQLRNFAPDCLFAYPSSLHTLCLLLDERSLRIPIRVVKTSSEVLNRPTVELAKKIFGCRYSDYYGQAERVAFAELIDDGRYRFLPGYAKVELGFSRHEDDSDLYEIIGTNLWNRAMPLIRFRTGDLIAVAKGTTADQLEEICLGLRPFDRIYGRDEGIFIHGPAGTRIYGMPKVMNGVNHVYHSQIIQEALDSIRIVVVPTKEFGDADRDQILANARQKIPGSMRIDVVIGQRLETTGTGKVPFIIRKING